jgi:2-polyprenyl-6-methoxyphenol hydroxylase-like FAD-dependent oxidoreductase
VVTALLVGADGAWSRVRPLVTSAVPEYAGASVVETYLYDADTRHPATAKAVGGGLMVVPEEDKDLFAHRESGGTLHAYVQLTRDQKWFAATDFTDAAAAIARVAGEFDGFAPELTALITESDSPPVLRPHYTLPTGLRWDRVPGVTLLGDAAHLAPPNGDGANLAMADGAGLAKALTARPDAVEAALASYEEAMFRRNAEESSFGEAQLVELFSDENGRADLPAGTP